MDEFFKQMAPVLFANLLTVWFIWGLYTANKTEKSSDSTSYIIGTLSYVFVLLFMLAGFHYWGAFTELAAR